MQDTSEVRRASQCVGKEAYTSFVLASKIAKRRNRNTDQDPLGAYRCKWCSRFHIGTRKPRRFKPRILEAAE